MNDGDKKLREVISFKRLAKVKAGMGERYGYNDLEAYTFGIELEYIAHAGVGDLDNDAIRIALERNDSVAANFKRWLKRKRSNIKLLWNGKLEDWDDEFGPIDYEAWAEKNPEPREDGFSDIKSYDEAVRDWNRDYQRVWDGYRVWNKMDIYWKYIEDLIDTGEWEKYLDAESFRAKVSNVDVEVNEAITFLRYRMGQFAVEGDGSDSNTWAVGDDGPPVVEIRSKHLKQSEFNLVDSICKFVGSRSVHGGTSAHVHIGLPEDFDVFDLLAMTTLVDEKAVVADAGPGRKFAEFAKMRESLHDEIIRLIYNFTPSYGKDEFEISNERLMDILRILDKNHGTNVRSFFRLKTVEFRYFSSMIAKNSDKFIKWIQYFLLLPKVAKMKRRVTIRKNDITLVATRGSGKVIFEVTRRPGGVDLSL